MGTIRTVTAVVAARGWTTFQLYLNIAFIHRDFDEELYVGMSIGISDVGNKVCKSLFMDSNKLVENVSISLRILCYLRAIPTLKMTSWPFLTNHPLISLSLQHTSMTF